MATFYNGGGFTSRACGIYVPEKGTITVDHPGAIDIDLDATYYYYGGIGVMTKDSHVIINNDVDPAHRVKIRATTPLSGFEMNVTGLKTFSGTIDIAGLVDIYTDRAWGTNAAGGRISVGGGTIHTDNYDAVTARSGGIMNMNIQGTAETGLTPGENDVTIVGNLGSMGAWVGADENAEVNVALMNEHSSLTGRAHEVENTPDEGKVGIRLFLQNGSKWYNTGGLFPAAALWRP